MKKRSNIEISNAIGELLDKIWYDRHQVIKQKNRTKQKNIDAKIWEETLKNAKTIEKEYGKENLGPYTDFEWGELNGKLSALRWVLGYEWDMLDT